MFQALNEVVQIIKELPAYAVWIIAGFMFYKITIVGSIYSVIRLAINRTFDWLSRDKVVIEKFEIYNKEYVNFETRILLEDLIKEIKSIKGYSSSFLDEEKVRIAIDYIREAKKKNV